MPVQRIYDTGPTMLPGNSEMRAITFTNHVGAQYTVVAQFGKVYAGKQRYSGSRQRCILAYYDHFYPGSQPFYVEELDPGTNRGVLNLEFAIQDGQLYALVLTDTGSSNHVHEKKLIVYELSARAQES